MKLRERTVLVTGGTSGIGRELAAQLLESGNRVIVTGRDSRRLDDTRQALPGVHAIQSDVSDPAAIAALFSRVSNEHPPIDVLINNAGVMRNLDLLKSDGIHDLTLEIDIGLSGPILMTQRFLPQLLSRPQAAIVNITSGLAFVPMPLSPIYSAAKAGLHAYTRSLRAQLAESRVAVFEVAPPGVETPLFRGEFAEEMKGQKAMPVDQLVRHAIAAIESNRAESTPGPAKALYALSRIAPNFIFQQLAKFGPRRQTADK